MGQIYHNPERVCFLPAQKSFELSLGAEFGTFSASDSLTAFVLTGTHVALLVKSAEGLVSDEVTYRVLRYTVRLR